MLTAKQIEEANKGIKPIPVKNKNYAPVNERVQAFRRVCPGGSITTEFLKLTEEECYIRATVADEGGAVLATGTAWERKGATNINRTSYIENCETSAVGRALGFCGIGIQDSIGAAEEVASAIMQQEMLQPCSKAEKNSYRALCKQLNQDEIEILKRAGWTGGPMTVEHYGRAMLLLKEIEEAENY